MKIDVELSIVMEQGATFEVYRSKSLLKSQRWRWRLVAENGKILAMSSEGYTNETVCKQSGIDVVSGSYYSESALLGE